MNADVLFEMMKRSETIHLCYTDSNLVKCGQIAAPGQSCLRTYAVAFSRARSYAKSLFTFEDQSWFFLQEVNHPISILLLLIQNLYFTV